MFDSNILLDILKKIIALSDVIITFLFQEITVGEWTFSLWQVLGGGLFAVLFIAWLIKKLVPVA
jgi:hypothetical protein